MKKRTVGRPRDGTSAETRREILEAAEECFAASGFVGATTRHVASRASVNIATIHYHFGSKEGLYRAVLEAAEKARVALPDPVGAGRTAAGKVAVIVAALYDAGRARPALARLGLLDLLAGPPAAAAPGTAKDAEDPRVAALRKTLTSVKSAPSDASRTRGMPPAMAARWIVTLIDSALLATPVAGGGATKDAASATAASKLSKAAVVLAALKISGLS